MTFFPEEDSTFSPNALGSEVNSRRISISPSFFRRPDPETDKLAMEAAARILVSDNAVHTLLATREPSWVDNYHKNHPNLPAHIQPTVFIRPYTFGGWINLSQAVIRLAEDLVRIARLKDIWIDDVQTFTSPRTLRIGHGRLPSAQPALAAEVLNARAFATTLNQENAASSIKTAHVGISETTNTLMKDRIVIAFDGAVRSAMPAIGRAHVELDSSGVKYQHEITMPVFGWLDLQPPTDS